MEPYRDSYETDEEYEVRRQHRRDIAAKIQAEIDQRGISAVLADMISEPTRFALYFSSVP